MPKNELLEREINYTIAGARAELPEHEKEKNPLFYTLIIILITIAVLYSLLRSLL
ncbi:hypothetical protein [Streptococcus hyointestinalis]|uniref:hypothetical protein n=1 Tax=Streptococcus hyointestinalis TaxID=1337 RepID=UPI0013DFD1A3|nr:hypothetical protein [Streptococcus hyointestinalis]